VRKNAQLLKLFDKAAIAAGLLMFLAMFGFFMVSATYAQSRASGEIRGTVLDSSGAAIPGVAVSILNQLTGVVTRLTSDNSGIYVAASLDPGTYTVSFQREGFNKVIKSDITLYVEAITVDATLQAGSVSEQIEVKGGAPLVQTETSDLSQTITAIEVSELPSVNRYWMDYTYLLPGANGQMTSNSFNNNNNGSGAGFNGQGGYQMLGLQDGGTATFLPGQNYVVVPIQAIGEVQMSTSNFSAEYSNGLAVFNVIIKSGTNKFHGEVFEFVQNDKFEARNFFSPSIPPLRWNMYGGTLGGPIKKNKAFFFVSYQRNPTNTPSAAIATYPTAAEREGNLAGLPTIYDPNTLAQSGTIYTRTPFANNQIPLSQLDPAAIKIMKYMPMPNIPSAGNVNNYYYAVPAPNNSWNLDWKGSYNISSGNRLDFSENLYEQNQPGEGPTCPIDCVSNDSHYSTYVISDVWTVNPNTVNEFRGSLMRSHQPFAEADTGTNYGQTLGMAQLTALTFPGITIDGSGAPAAIGTSFKHSLLGYTTFTEADTLTFIHGKHILKFGGEYNNSRDNLAWADLNAGNFSFTGQFSENPQNPSATGAGLADFLLGVPGSWSDGWTPATGNRTGTAQAFAQDDFKITPRLTLNIGLRWLQQRGYTEQFNRIGTFDPTINNPATNTLGAMWYGGQRIGIRANGNNALQATKWANFQPRIGFAWAPKNNWSIRGGYGIFDDMWGGDTYQSGVGVGTSVAGNDSAGLHGNPLVRFMTLDAGHPPPAIPAFPPSAAFYNGSGVTYWPYHIPMAYVQQGHVSVQHQFNNNTMLEVGYVWTRGVHLPNPSDLNQVPATGIQQIIAAGGISVNVQPYRPYPQYTGITLQAMGGWSDYNSLQMSLKKRMSHGLLLQTSYTYGHALDTNTQNGWNGPESDFQIALNPRLSYGNSQIDLRHTFSGSFIYELPFGTGKALLNRGTVLNGFVGGWQISNTWQAQTGVPFTPTWGGGGSDFSGSGTWYPNRVCNGAISNPTIQEWFNPACFPSAALGTYGNSGRDVLFGPGFFNMNTALAKSFKLRWLGEAGLLHIRADAFDVLNHPNFGQPNASIVPGLVGVTTSTATITSARTQRNVQLGARIVF
jgi:hypothetical protein